MQTDERLSGPESGCAPADLRSELDASLQLLRANPSDTRLGELALELASRLNDLNAAINILEVQAQGLNDVLSWVKAALFCEQIMKIGRAVNCYEQALKIEPDNKDALYLAARATTSFGRFGQGLRYFERLLDGRPATLLPPDVLSLYLHAYIRSNRAGKPAAQIIRETAPYLRESPHTLRSQINTAAQCCEHRLVHELNTYYVRHWPAADLMPHEWVVWLRAITLTPDASDLDSIADAALQALDGWLSRATLPPSYRLPDVHMARARVLHLAGRDYRPALDQCLALPGYPRSLTSLSSTAPLAEKVFRANYPQWRERFAGTDVCMLLNGPSLHALEPHLHAIRSADQARFVVFNDFVSVLDRILTPIGRNVDAVTVLAAEALEDSDDAIIGLLDSPAKPFLISMPTVLNGQRRSEDLLRFDHQLLLASSHLSLPPTPGNGLNFEFVNSLSLVMNLILTAEPRRIFLFGADGGRNTSNDGLYFDGRHLNGIDPSAAVENVYFELLKAEAELTDAILEFELPVAAEVYGVKLPEIYNVCPTSNHQLFKKIDVETAVAMLNDPGAPSPEEKQDH